MKISDDLIDELNASIAKLEELVDQEPIRIRGVKYRDGDDAMEAQLYDAADEEYEHQIQLEREHALCDALDECVRMGVGVRHLRVLARECGACTWAMRQSLKG
ncbi:MAG TPA: hypothetical protein VFU31_24820 [Candidatus Binatia bacterium]|nr:hypothetical protein [Candidatus Binatia bacterium]